MALGTGIEWTDATWNVLAGCTPVSPGCLNCYAATMARRLEAMGKAEYQARDGVRIAEVRNGRAVFTGDVRLVPDRLTDPLHWRKPRRVFVNSMSDLFHEAVPWSFIREVFEVIRDTPRHTYQILTKRPERMAMMERETGLTCPPHAWAGTSVENQATADERIPHLLRCPAAVRFLSCEPLLGPVDLRFGDSDGVPTNDEPCRERHWLLHWVIVGGESGPNARPCDVAWIRSVVSQCKEAGVPCFVKQLGSEPCIRVKDFGDTVTYCKTGGFWPNTQYGEANAWIPRIADRKGADPAEWPEDLRVRQFPEARR